MKKIKLAIISEKTRSHFQKPLEKFPSDIEIAHFYKSTYDDLKTISQNMHQYKNTKDLYQKLVDFQPDIIQGLEPYYGGSRLKIPYKIIRILNTTSRYVIKYKPVFFFHVLENLPPEKKYGYLAGAVMKKIATKYASLASKIIYLNEGAKNNIGSWQVSPQKTVKNLWGIWGVDRSIFIPSTNKRKNQLLFVGSLTTQKGVLDAIKIYKKIAKIKPRLNFVIVGLGPKLKSVQKLIVGNKKITLLQNLNQEGVAQQMQESLILIAPSKDTNKIKEQVGMVNLEALSCGLPVVTTDNGSIREFVIDEEGIKIIPQNNIDLFVGACLELLDKKEWQKQSNLAQNYIDKYYNSAKNIPALIKFVQNLTS